MDDPADSGPPKRRSPDAPRRQTAHQGEWLIARRYMTAGGQLQSGETLVRSQHRALSIGAVVSHLGPANSPYRRHPQRHPRTSPSSVPTVGADGIRVTLTPLNVTLVSPHGRDRRHPRHPDSAERHLGTVRCHLGLMVGPNCCANAQNGVHHRGQFHQVRLTPIGPRSRDFWAATPSTSPVANEPSSWSERPGLSSARSAPPPVKRSAVATAC